MVNKTKYLGFVVAIIFILGVAYLLMNKKTEPPYKVLTPDSSSYPAGTSISLYENTPPGFPSELLLEQKELDYSGTVTSAEGKVQATVSYFSDKTVQDILLMYKEFLPKNGWEFSIKVQSEKTTVIQAEKSGQKVIITAVASKEGKVTVLFQY